MWYFENWAQHEHCKIVLFTFYQNSIKSLCKWNMNAERDLAPPHFEFVQPCSIYVGYVRMGCLDNIVWASNIQNRFRKEIGLQCNLASITSGIWRHPTLKSSHSHLELYNSNFPEHFLLLEAWVGLLEYLVLFKESVSVPEYCCLSEEFFLFEVSVPFPIFSPVQGSVSSWNIFSFSKYLCLPGIFSNFQSICVVLKYFFLFKVSLAFQNIFSCSKYPRLSDIFFSCSK